MPRIGLGIPIISDTQSGPIMIDDLLWESFDSNQISINYQETRSNFVLHSQDATDTGAWTKTNTAIDLSLIHI